MTTQTISDIEQALRRIETGWQPIETAPKDGTRVLTYSPNKLGFHPIRINRWHAGTWWFTNQQHWPPTHWMHLPEPPK